jgi:hypothetical protein
MSISIQETDLQQILIEVGYPVLSYEDLPLKVDVIKSLCLLPAVMEFYIWNPKFIRREYAVGPGSFSLPFPEVTVPSASVLGPCSARLAQRTFQGIGKSSSAFANSIQFSKKAENYHIPNSLEMFETKLMEQKIAQAGEAMYGTRHIRYDEETRSVVGFANTPCSAIVSWAVMDTDFDNINPLQKVEAIKICKVHVLRAFGTLASQAQLGSNEDANYQIYLDRASTIEDELSLMWKGRNRAIIMRN